MNDIQKENKKLVEEYPFIRANNYWTMERLPEEKDDYSWTLLDDMPKGWKKAFGLDLCREIKEALLLEGEAEDFEGNMVSALDNYRVAQVKEKFGGLRWYDFGGTEQTEAIIDKYTQLSYKTCCECGAPATYISMGWICPWCDDCVKEINDEVKSIDNFYKER